MDTEYGRELGKFIFDGSYPKQEVIFTNGIFIIYEKGLLIKGLPPVKPIYIKWRDMGGVILYEEETTKVSIELENEEGEIVAESKTKSEDVIAFYHLITVQKEKYRYFDSLRELKVDLEEISIAMDSGREDNEVYLDTATGEIIYIPAELDEDNVYDDEYISSLPQWEKEMADDVRAIYEDEEQRYIDIPERTSSDGYDRMFQFTKGLKDVNLSERLFDALEGRGAFSRFKNILRRYPETEKQWYKYREEAEKQEVREWLWSIGIEPL